MGEDARLDDFLDDGAQAGDAATSDADGSGTSDADGSTSSDADASDTSNADAPSTSNGDDAPTTTADVAEGSVERDAGSDAASAERATSVDAVERTSRWDPDGVCDACGESAPRRWMQDDALVCSDCKSWAR